MKVYAKKRSDRKKKWSVMQENEVTGQVKTIASFQFKRDCDDFISNWRGDIETNRYINTNMTLAEFVEDSTEWYLSSYKTEQSAKNKLGTLKNIVLPKLGHRPLAEITVQEWEQLFIDMNTSKRLFIKEDHIHRKKVKKKITVYDSERNDLPSLTEFSDYLKTEICQDARKHRRKCPYTCYESGYKSCRCPQEVKEKAPYRINSEGKYVMCNQITVNELAEETGLDHRSIRHWQYAISYPSDTHWKKVYPYLKFKKYPVGLFEKQNKQVEVETYIGRHIPDEPYKFQTIKNTRRIIRRLYNRAKQLDLIKHPTIAIANLPHKMSVTHISKREVWTMEQTDLFLNFLKNPNTSLHKGRGLYGKDRDYFAFYLYAKKGLRKSELPAIRISRDIKFSDKGAVIQLNKQVDTSSPIRGQTEYKEISIKTAKSKDDYDVIGLDIQETELLKDHIAMITEEQADKNYKGEIDYLFSQKDGSLYSHGYFYHKFKRIIRNELNYQVPDIRLHDLRQSLATNLAPLVKPQDLQRIMRHTTYKTTETYYIHPKDESILDHWKDIGKDIEERKLV